MEEEEEQEKQEHQNQQREPNVQRQPYSYNAYALQMSWISSHNTQTHTQTPRKNDYQFEYVTLSYFQKKSTRHQITDHRIFE